MGSRGYTHSLDIDLPSGAETEFPKMSVGPSINDWTRVQMVTPIPESGTIDITHDARMSAPASPSAPLDFYLTQPVLSMASQPMTQRVEPALDGADQLTVALPALQGSWSVAVNGAEARTWAMSLVTGDGDAAIVRPTIFQSPVTDPDLTVRDGKDIALELATDIGGVETVHDRSAPGDVYFELQNVVVLTMSQPGDVLTMWV